MKRHTVTFLIFALVALIVFYPQQFSESGVVTGQQRLKRLKQTPRRVAKPQTAGTRVDYSNFSHATKKHQGACNTCHKAPTDNWKKVRDFPDVADYPGHDACVSCHRPQFFKGAKPVICSVCHTKVSPRDDARFAFRKSARTRQFTIEFPHDKHQDVIARLERPPYPAGPVRVMATSFSPPVTQTVRLRAWAHSRFVATETSQTNSLRYNILSARSAVVESERYNNCEICHVPRTTASVAPASGWIDGYTPPVDTFKAVPDNHASCFNCHWTRQEPIRGNCGGCHKLTNAPYVPPASPERKSMKFRHAGGGEKNSHAVPPSECTVCHINITKAATLRGLKPDVPITSCSECHNKDGLRQDVSKELEAIDKNRDFVCRYCHTSDVGRLDPPANHYLIAGREAMKRKDVK